jgi:hypothetical protein
MLAWIHQVMASEQEFLESLFDLKADGRQVAKSLVFPSSNPLRTKAKDTLAGGRVVMVVGVCDLVSPELGFSQARLGLVPRSNPRTICEIKPPGHWLKPR